MAISTDDGPYFGVGSEDKVFRAHGQPGLTIAGSSRYRFPALSDF